MSLKYCPACGQECVLHEEESWWERVFGRSFMRCSRRYPNAKPPSEWLRKRRADLGLDDGSRVTWAGQVGLLDWEFDDVGDWPDSPEEAWAQLMDELDEDQAS